MLFPQPKRVHLDLYRPWPAVTSCSFSHQLSSVTYQGPTTSAAPPPPSPSSPPSQDGAAVHSQPKGVVIYANSSISPQVRLLSNKFSPEKCHFLVQSPSFYWELELTHLADSTSDAAHVAMGYSPVPRPADGQPWTYPQETVLLRRLVPT